MIDSPNVGGSATARTVTRSWSYPLPQGNAKQPTTVYTDRNAAVTTTVIDAASRRVTTSAMAGSGASVTGSYARSQGLNADGSVAWITDATYLTDPNTPHAQSSLQFQYDALGRVNVVTHGTSAVTGWMKLVVTASGPSDKSKRKPFPQVTASSGLQ